MEKKVVNVYVMRHGEKGSGPNDLAVLTGAGREQVMKSAQNNLTDITFDGLFCSLKFRALETVVCATSVLPDRNNGLGVKAQEEFDYSSAPDLERFKELSAEVEKRSESEKRPATVALWQEVAPAMISHLRKKITDAIVTAAIEVAEDSAKDEDNILVGCHSPSSELACLNPEKMPMLRESDIVKYTVEVYKGHNKPGGGKIVSSKYISRGF